MSDALQTIGAGRDLILHHQKVFHGDTWRILRREDVSNALMSSILQFMEPFKHHT